MYIKYVLDLTVQVCDFHEAGGLSLPIECQCPKLLEGF